MKTIYKDYTIIGSGFGAAAPALRLSQAGHNVLLIEKGSNIRGKADFEQTQDPKYLKQYLKSLSGDNINFTYAEGLGGGSGFYEMVSLRAPSMAFNQQADKGTLLWPDGVNRQSLDPYYDVAEMMLNVTQIPVERVPKSGIAFSMLMKNLNYSCERARYAVIKCLGSGYCISGCVFGAKQSLHYNYIPQAEQHGLEILTGTEAHSIVKLAKGNKYKYKIYCSTTEGEKIEVQTNCLILGAGTVGTAKLLLNSKENLPLLSDQLGKNICFNGGVKTGGLLPKGFIEGDMFSGMSHPGMISYHFLKSKGITVSSAKPLPVYLLDSKQFSIKGHDKNGFWGASNVELMKLYRRRMVVLYALGLAPQTAEIKHLGKDKFQASLQINKQLKEYYHTTNNTLNSILEDNNCKVLEVKQFDSKWKQKDDVRFSTTHMSGSCRMGRNSEEGVVDSSGEVFGYPGIYITDGAVIPSSLAVNTSLTILANAERIADNIVRRYS